MLTLSFPVGDTYRVSSGTVELPRTGIWIADVKMISQTIPSGPVVATLGPVPMLGTVAVAQLVNGVIDLRVVGGAGGLGNAARPKHYHQPLVNHVLTDLMRDAGEMLSPDCTPAVVNAPLEAWTTLGLPATTGTMLAALCAILGCNWRVLSDGTVWIGAEDWPDSGVAYRSIDTDGANAAQVVGTDGPAIWPGMLLGGRRVDFVTHDLDSNRTRILFAEVA